MYCSMVDSTKKGVRESSSISFLDKLANLVGSEYKSNRSLSASLQPSPLYEVTKIIKNNNKKSIITQKLDDFVSYDVTCDVVEVDELIVNLIAMPKFCTKSIQNINKKA